MAWELRTKSAGKRAGFVFVRPSQEQDEPEAEEQPEEIPAASKTK
jgi:hypothetical protein